MADDVVARRPELRLFDFLFLLRPTALVPLWIFQLAGIANASRAAGLGIQWFGIPGRAAIGLAAMTLVLGGGYVLNQITDIESDRANRKLFLLSDGLVTRRAAWIEVALLWGSASLLSFAVSPQCRWMVAASLALNASYSLGPVRAKSRIPLDLIWNGLGFGVVAFGAGWASVAALNAGGMVAALSYALAVAGVIASTTILDIRGDETQRAATTGAVLGARRTSWLAICLLVLAAAVGWFARDVIGFFGPVLSLPLFMKAHLSGRRSDRIAGNQIAVAVFALLVGMRLPLMLVLLAATYAGTRAYYKARFGLAFPGRGTP